MPASLIFHNVRVLTMEPSRPLAEAVAVASDRLLAVGSEAWVARQRGPQTRPGLHTVQTRAALCYNGS